MRKINKQKKESQLVEMLVKPEKTFYMLLALGLACFSVAILPGWNEVKNVPAMTLVDQPVIQKIALVKGESTQNNEVIKLELRKEYENSLKSVLVDYFITRVNCKSVDCLEQVNLITQKNILNLRIPKEYRKLHLEGEKNKISLCKECTIMYSEQEKHYEQI